MFAIRKIGRRASVLVAGVVLGLSFNFDAIAQSARPDHMQITHHNGRILISVPVSRLKLSLPASDLTDGGSKPGSRYFQFFDKGRGLIISGWFEPAHLFKGIDAFWEAETASWKKNNLPQALHVEKSQQGAWDTVSYDLNLPQLSNTHVRAHLVRAGTWIDVHLSITGKGDVSEYRQLLLEILKQVEVSETSSEAQK